MVLNEPVKVQVRFDCKIRSSTTPIENLTKEVLIVAEWCSPDIITNVTTPN